MDSPELRLLIPVEIRGGIMEYEKALVETMGLRFGESSESRSCSYLISLRKRRGVEIDASYGRTSAPVYCFLILLGLWGAYQLFKYSHSIQDSGPGLIGVMLAVVTIVFGPMLVGNSIKTWLESGDAYESLVRPWTLPLLKAIDRYNEVVNMLENAIRVHQVRGQNPVFTEWIQSQIELLSREKERLLSICSTYEQLKNVPASLDKDMARTFSLSPVIAPEANQIVERTQAEIGDFTDSLEKIETSIRDFHPEMGSWK